MNMLPVIASRETRELTLIIFSLCHQACLWQKEWCMDISRLNMKRWTRWICICLVRKVLICAIIWNSVVKVSPPNNSNSSPILLFFPYYSSYIEWLPTLENLLFHSSNILYTVYIYLPHFFYINQHEVKLLYGNSRYDSWLVID